MRVANLPSLTGLRMKQILRQIAGLLIAFGAFMLPSAHAAGRDPASSRRVSFSETEIG